ncbi:MAG: hypothetical protein WA655_23645, partial [Candidatus Korobacteraceae bacterium]
HGSFNRHRCRTFITPFQKTHDVIIPFQMELRGYVCVGSEVKDAGHNLSRLGSPGGLRLLSDPPDDPP